MTLKEAIETYINAEARKKVLERNILGANTTYSDTLHSLNTQESVPINIAETVYNQQKNIDDLKQEQEDLLEDSNRCLAVIREYLLPLNGKRIMHHFNHDYYFHLDSERNVIVSNNP